MKSRIWIVVAILAVLTVAGAATYWFVFMPDSASTADSDFAEAALPPRLPADRASVFCMTLGGTATFKKSNGTEVGVCALPDGRTCAAEALAASGACNSI